MARKAAIPIPPRINDDLKNNDGRGLKLFLQSVKERLDALSTATTSTTTATPTVTILGGGSTGGNADTLDGFDSSAFAIKAENETITGTWTFSSSITANRFIETSDRRLKKFIKPLKNALDVVKSLVGVSYVRKDTDEHEIGFIAQDVKRVLPELVSQHGEYLGVNYSRIVAVLVEALKEQDKRITDLEAQITTMERIK